MEVRHIRKKAHCDGAVVTEEMVKKLRAAFDQADASFRRKENELGSLNGRLEEKRNQTTAAVMEMAAFTIPDKTVQADVLIDEVRKLHVIWEKRTEKTEARLRTLEKEHRSYQEHKKAAWRASFADKRTGRNGSAGNRGISGGRPELHGKAGSRGTDATGDPGG